MTSQRNSGRNYGLRFGAAMTVYAILLLVGVYSARVIPDSPWRFVLVSLPVIGLALAVWAVWRFIVESDEMQARKLLEMLAFSIAGTLLITFVAGMVEIADGPHIGLVWVTPLWAIMFGLGGVVVGRKYR